VAVLLLDLFGDITDSGHANNETPNKTRAATSSKGKPIPATQLWSANSPSQSFLEFRCRCDQFRDFRCRPRQVSKLSNTFFSRFPLVKCNLSTTTPTGGKNK